jgi:hypothetical protein
MQPGVDSERTVRTAGCGGWGAASSETGRHGGQAGQPKTVSSRWALFITLTALKISYAP